MDKLTLSFINLYPKNLSMRDSNTVLYIVLAIVVIHFLIGFAFLAYKLLGPVKKTNDKETKTN